MSTGVIACGALAADVRRIATRARATDHLPATSCIATFHADTLTTGEAPCRSELPVGRLQRLGLARPQRHVVV